ncbi:hypothetical protein XENOCAPTIV_021453 [Xenoophorus captivus]|uniref:Uncharacterized protein n=1 Tax=Xenoophorus captivus TaxID=1517983 RepID=A0ABV0QK96_9TELE
MWEMPWQDAVVSIWQRRKPEMASRNMDSKVRSMEDDEQPERKVRMQLLRRSDVRVSNELTDGHGIERGEEQLMGSVKDLKLFHPERPFVPPKDWHYDNGIKLIKSSGGHVDANHLPLQ